MYTKLSNACSQLVHVSVKGERGIKWKRGGNRPRINYYVCACVCVSVREMCSGCRLADCSPTLSLCVGVMLLLVHAGIIRYRISPIQHGMALYSQTRPSCSIVFVYACSIVYLFCLLLKCQTAFMQSLYEFMHVCTRTHNIYPLCSMIQQSHKFSYMYTYLHI